VIVLLKLNTTCYQSSHINIIRPSHSFVFGVFGHKLAHISVFLPSYYIAYVIIIIVATFVEIYFLNIFYPTK